MKAHLSVYHKVLFYVCGLLFSSWSCLAQYENVWAFGNNAGLDFNYNPPIAIKTNINTSEGSASICDSTGQLLFYTDGTDVRDRNHNMMPDGKDLTGLGTNITASTTQGALIIPRPGNAGQYYVFSLGAYTTTEHYGLLYYSIIDMSLNNGLGDVLPGSKAILLDSLLTEHMTAVSGNDCNVWLLVISRTTRAIKSYRVDASGIDPNPGSSPGIPGGGLFLGVLGSIDVSPDRSQLAVAQGNLVLYDFDPGSGRASRPFVLDKNLNPYYYGVSFSPDNTQLYASTMGELYQFDLRSQDSATRVGSRIRLANGVFYPAIRRGPDSKIYLASYEKEDLNVVNQPNLSGTACQYVAGGISLFPGTKSQLGLPNLATMVNRRKVTHVQEDTLFCVSSLTLNAKNLSGTGYVWNDGQTGPVRTVDSAGVYWVSYQVASPCMFDECTDTFKVTRDFSRRVNRTSTTLSGWCQADTLLLTATNLNASGYTWEDSTMGTQRQVNRPGLYVLRYAIDSLCADFEDLFQVSYPEADYTVSFTTDTLVCMDEVLSLRNTSDPYYQDFQWWFGDGDTALGQHATHTYSRDGLYEVILVGKLNAICVDTAYAQIVVDAPLSNSFVRYPDRVCVGAAVDFESLLQHHTLLDLHWKFGDGSALSSGLDRRIQHAYEDAGGLPVLLTTTFRACPADTFRDTVVVYAAPDVYLGTDAGLCYKGTPINLSNLRAARAGKAHYLWNTGDTTMQLRVTRPGTYSLRLSEDPLGCTATATIEITRDCYLDIPNAFTPDSDGQNDYFFPRQLLSQNITQFRMFIFDRWGRKVFETTGLGGRGWDGRLNGLDQPQGVYVYRIEVTFDGQLPKEYRGNVTLLR